MAEANDVPAYYDILLVGRTGQGKSTLGNKLLEADQFKTSDWQEVSEEDKLLSVTTTCKLAEKQEAGENEERIRVLDTPGFSSTDFSRTATVFEANLQIFRWIVREQLDPRNNMKVRRILYFLPDRGTPKKADGLLQEELKVMFYFFGPKLFGCMVLIATQDEEYQSFLFSNERCTQVQRVFCVAVEKATGTKDIKMPRCPPVVYVGKEEWGKAILDKIKSAPIIDGSDGSFTPEFVDDVCARCSSKIFFNKNPESEIHVPVGGFKKDNDGEYYDLKCHPCMIPKYSKLQKFVGGVAHVVLLGIPYAVGKKKNREYWPGLWNSEEKCGECDKPIGSPPCWKLSEVYKGEKITHTNKLDKIKFVDEDLSMASELYAGCNS